MFGLVPLLVGDSFFANCWECGGGWVLVLLWDFLYYGYKNHVYSAKVFLPVWRGVMVEKVKVYENREKVWHVWARRRCNDRI